MKLTATKKERRIFRVLLILMIFSLLVTGCGQNADTDPDNDGKDPDTSIGESPDNGNGETDANEGTNPDNGNGETDTSVGAVLESGFKPSGSGEPSPDPNFCAYKSDTNEFDIDNVTLDFFFGGHYHSGVEFELTHGRNYPAFDLYFIDEDDNKFFIKHIEENFVSEKYSCEVTHDEHWHITEIKYNHSEKLTIPSEIFTKENGVIWFSIYSIHANDIEQAVRCITCVKIFYQVIGEKVVLSSRQI